MWVQMLDSTAMAPYGRLMAGCLVDLDVTTAGRFLEMQIAQAWTGRRPEPIAVPVAPRALPQPAAPPLLPARTPPKRRSRAERPRFPVYRPLALPERTPVQRRERKPLRTPTGGLFTHNQWNNRNVPWAKKGEARLPEYRQVAVLEDEGLVADLAGPFLLDEVMSRAARENAQATVGEIDVAYGWRYRWWQDWE